MVYKRGVVSTAESIYDSHVLHGHNRLMAVTIDQISTILDSRERLICGIENCISDVVRLLRHIKMVYAAFRCNNV